MLMVILMAMLSVSAWAQTPPHVQITKELQETGEEICPGAILDVTIRLSGAGSTAYMREPINAVVVIDKSGSMNFGGKVGYDKNKEPPYAPQGTPGYNQQRDAPFVQTVWAAWKFYEYLIFNAPTLGTVDHGGLVWYSANDRPAGVPGTYAVRTPTPIQRHSDPSSLAHKIFWWDNYLSKPLASGGTAMGPGMQEARDIIGAMRKDNPDRPNFMVMMSDGQPNLYWTPRSTPMGATPREEPPWPNTGSTNYRSYMHAIEIARRSSLAEELNEGTEGRYYPQVWDTTIYTLGLGIGVDHNLMNQLADPWHPSWWDGKPRPPQSHTGFYAWAQTENDLIDTFEAIAGHILSNVAGSEIQVLEIVPSFDGMCPGGAESYTEIVPNSWNYPPTIIPPAPGDPDQNYRYTWDFSELLIGDEIEITFQMMVTDDVPLNATGLLIECPESEVSYKNYLGTPQAFEIVDPGFTTGDCDAPTPTPTFTPTPTPTPTCAPETLMFDDFEAGNFDEWDYHDPNYGVKISKNANYAHSGEYFAFFAGCEPGSPGGLGTNEAVMLKRLDFSDPIRPGAVLEFYMMIKGFVAPQKSGRDIQLPYDMFTIEITDEHSRRIVDQYAYGDLPIGKYFHYRKSLQPFAGSNQVRIRLLTYFPVTTVDPHPDDSGEPMVFIDDVLVYDYCYEPTPTPTATPVPPPPIPSTSPRGIGLALLIIGLIIGLPMLRKVL